MVGKPNNPIPSVPQQPIPVASEPFEKIIIDCVGPLPRTIFVNDHGQYYPLSFKTINAKNVARCLLRFFTHVLTLASLKLFKEIGARTSLVTC